MKTNYWIALLAVLLILCAVPGYFLLAPGEDAAFAVIYSQGELIRYVDLMNDQEFTVDTPGGGHNVVTVKGGKIAVTQANCPDHYCMERGFCSSGAQIVCLPNQLVIGFEGKQEVDGFVG